MRRTVFWAFVSLLATSVPAQSAMPLSGAVQRDVQCFMLYSIAVDTAVKAKEEKTQEAASLGVMYFVGKLAVESPGLNLADAVRQEADGMTGNPRAKDWRGLRHRIRETRAATARYRSATPNTRQSIVLALIADQVQLARLDLLGHATSNSRNHASIAKRR
jgi:hypothetical protein